MTKLVNTAGKIVAFVEVLENTKDAMIKWRDGKMFQYLCDGKWNSIDIPSGKWQILGDSRTLTEEHMKEICKTRKVKQSWDSHTSDLFIDYANAGKYVETVQESYSLMKEANGIVDSNPYANEKGEMLDINNFNGCGGVVNGELLTMGGYAKAFDQAQSLVKRFLVLVSQE